MMHKKQGNAKKGKLMTNFYSSKFSIFFLLLLVSSLFFSSVQADRYRFLDDVVLTEDFDDDVRGQLPSEEWYTLGTGWTRVANATLDGTGAPIAVAPYSSPHHLYSSSFLQMANEYIINEPKQFKEMGVMLYSFEYLRLYNHNNTLNDDSIFIRIEEDGSSVKASNGSGYTSFPADISTDEYAPYRIYIDWENQTYDLKISNETGTYWLYNLDFITASSSLTRVLIPNYYTGVDDFYLLYDYSLDAELIAPDNNSFLSYDEIELSVNITDPCEGWDSYFVNETEFYNITYYIAYNSSCPDHVLGEPCYNGTPHSWRTLTSFQFQPDELGILDYTIELDERLSGMTDPLLWANMTYYWRIEVEGNNTQHYLPSEGYLLSPTSDDAHYCWLFSLNSSTPPNITIAHISEQNYSVNISSETFLRSYDIILYDEWGQLVYHEWDDALDSTNEYIILQLEDHIGMERRYTLNVTAHNTACGNATAVSGQSYIIGRNHSNGVSLSIRNLNIEHQDWTAYEMIGRPMSLDICMNVSGYIYYYICDSNNAVIATNIKNARGTVTSWFNSYPALGWDEIFLPIRFMNIKTPVYNSFSTASRFFQKDRFYTVYIGLRTSQHGTSIYPEQVYDLSAQEVPRFSYKIAGFFKDYRIIENWDESYDMIGFKISFGTFREDPFTASDNPYDVYNTDWGENIAEQASEATGFPHIGIVIAFLIIAGFSFMPIIITKTVPPLPIQSFFTGTGFIIAFASGFLPLWIFALIFLFVLVFIFYKLMAWARAQGITSSVADVHEKFEERGRKFVKPRAEKIVGKAKGLWGKRKPFLKDKGVGRY